MSARNRFQIFLGQQCAIIKNNNIIVSKGVIIMEPKNQLECNRRDFLKYASVGAAALVVPTAGFAANKGKMPTGRAPQEDIATTDVLIIGGGYAGVLAAVKAREKGVHVTLVEKGTIFRSGLSPFARGFAYFDKATQDPDTLVKYSNMVGEYLGNEPYLRMWIDDSKAIYEEIKSWGFFNAYIRFMDVMRDQVIKKGVNVIERTMITNLIKQNNKIVGAVGFPAEEDKAIVITAKAVVLCAGAGAFKPPGYFANSITSDSDAMAYRIGAEITGKEFQDTHKTRQTNPAASWDNWEDQLAGTNPGVVKACLDGNLTLRASIQAHTEGVSNQSGNLARSGGQSGRGGAGSSKAGRPMGGTSRKDPGGGITWGSPRDLTLEREPGTKLIAQRSSGASVGGASAGLAPHKCEGLWPADDKCQTNIDGLFAAGDALGSAMCGGTYTLGAGSSSASAVQGANAGSNAAEYALKISKPSVSKTEIDRIKIDIFEPRQRDKGYSPGWLIQLIQSTMTPYYVLYVKKKDRLQAALTNIVFYQEHFASNLMAQDTHDLRLAHEVKNMLLNAEMKLRASLFRTESRANHFREDFPARDDNNWLARVIVSNENGKMKLTKLPIDDSSKPDPNVSYEERYPNRFPGELEYIESNKIN